MTRKYQDNLESFKKYCLEKNFAWESNGRFYRRNEIYICITPEETEKEFVYNSIASTFSKMLVPSYIQNILKRVYPLSGTYTFRLVGADPNRRAHGINEDISKLKRWAVRQGADFLIKEQCAVPNCYYIIFEMTDPVVQGLEIEGYLSPTKK